MLSKRKATVTQQINHKWLLGRGNLKSCPGLFKYSLKMDVLQREKQRDHMASCGYTLLHSLQGEERVLDSKHGHGSWVS